MSFFKEYSTAIIIVSILTVLLEHLIPNDNNKKYINLIVGLLTTAVILVPMIRITSFNLSCILPETKTKALNINQTEQDYLINAFEKNLSKQISRQVNLDMSQSISCHVTCTYNENKQITGIQSVKISPYTPELIVYIAKQFGLKEDSIIP